MVVNTSNYHIILNTKKGGSFKLFFKNSNKVAYDSGLQIQSGKNKFVSSLLSNNNISTINNEGIIIHGSFCKIKTSPMSPLKNILLRKFQLLFGWSDFLGFLVKKVLRNKLITEAKPSLFKFSRKISFDKTIKIEDSINNINKIDQLIIGGKFSYNYIPSSRYFQPSELNSTQIKLLKQNLINKASFIREYDSKGNLAFATKPLYRK